MREYRHTLEKYSGPSSRFTCPKCGAKREFTRYKDIRTDEYIAENVGKCNRVDKCGYHYTPAEYFKDNPQVDTFTNTKRCKRVNSSPAIKVHTLDTEWCGRSIGANSNHVIWLFRYFSREVVLSLIQEYQIGNTRDGRTIFWQIDASGGIRTGKVMQYDPISGRRTKGQGSCNWVHSILQRQGKLPANFELKQCIYGEHLFAKYPDKTIAITESYKSANVGWCVMPDYIWASVDSISGLSVQRCKSLRGRSVIFFPDLGRGFTEWSEKIPALAKSIGFKYSISMLLERTATPAQRQNGYDIADYITERIWQGSPVKHIADRLYEEDQAMFDRLYAKNPLVAKLVDALDLEFARSGRKPQITEL